MNKRHLVAKLDSRRNSTKSFKSRSGGNMSSNVRSFIILRSEEGLTFFSINNPTNFFGEKSSNESFRGVFF